MNNVEIICKCGKVGKHFAIRLEERTQNNWSLVWAYKIDDSKVSSRKNNVSNIKGSFILEDEYPGCPYCHAKSFFRCGKCGNLTCYNQNDQEIVCSHCKIKTTIQGRITSLKGKKTQ